MKSRKLFLIDDDIVDRSNVINQKSDNFSRKSSEEVEKKPLLFNFNVFHRLPFSLLHTRKKFTLTPLHTAAVLFLEVLGLSKTELKYSFF